MGRTHKVDPDEEQLKEQVMQAAEQAAAQAAQEVPMIGQVLVTLMADGTIGWGFNPPEMEPMKALHIMMVGRDSLIAKMTEDRLRAEEANRSRLILPGQGNNGGLNFSTR